MPFFFFGSRSSQFKNDKLDNNPLPPCPDSPNCVRISRKIDLPKEKVWINAKKVIRQMDPIELELNESGGKIEAVFRVFLFKDDFTIRVSKHNGSAILHLRSASREGYSDLGVNRRRVKRFLKLILKK